MPDEKRMIMDYEVTTALRIGGTEIAFCEDNKAENTFMVCNITRNNAFGVEEYSAGVGGPDYIELMNVFLSRASALLKDIEAERAERGVSAIPLTAADCIEDSHREDYTGQIVVIKPEHISPASRTADHQLVYATHGNGCRPDARGTSVFGQTLFSGENTRWRRYDVAGIIPPDRLPAWAKEKLAALEKNAEKPSLLGRLVAAKQEAAARNTATASTPGQKKDHER